MNENHKRDEEYLNAQSVYNIYIYFILRYVNLKLVNGIKQNFIFRLLKA